MGPSAPALSPEAYREKEGQDHQRNENCSPITPEQPKLVPRDGEDVADEFDSYR